jgi:hypothetical protein
VGFLFLKDVPAENSAAIQLQIYVQPIGFPNLFLFWVYAYLIAMKQSYCIIFACSPLHLSVPSEWSMGEW